MIDGFFGTSLDCFLVVPVFIVEFLEIKVELLNLIKERPSYVMTYIKETFGFTDAQMEDYFGESLKMIEAQSGK